MFTLATCHVARSPSPPIRNHSALHLGAQGHTLSPQGLGQGQSLGRGGFCSLTSIHPPQPMLFLERLPVYPDAVSKEPMVLPLKRRRTTKQKPSPCTRCPWTSPTGASSSLKALLLLVVRGFLKMTSSPGLVLTDDAATWCLVSVLSVLQPGQPFPSSGLPSRDTWPLVVPHGALCFS